MGEVWRARDTTLDREVALKVIPEELADDPELMERFSREARLLAAIDHPNIVTAYSVEESDGFHFITMQLVDGRTLDDLIPENGLPLDELLELAIPLVSAIGAAHHRGITHRDLKPANIMVSVDGWLRVLDFGIAKPPRAPQTEERSDASRTPDGVVDEAGQDLTQVGTVMGTLTYMSPEQAVGKPADARSDLFSLGVTLYETATGVRPFRGGTSTDVIDAILHVTPPAAEELNTQLPRDLSQAIARLLEKEPDARFQSADELLEVLETIRRAQSVTRKWAIPVAVAATALLVFAVYSVWQARNVRWAREVALPEAMRLAQKEQRFIEANDLALQARRYIPEDPMLNDQYMLIARELTVTTEPEGVEVRYSPYDRLDGDWTLVGVTPLNAVRIPRGYYRWRLTKEGYEPVETTGFGGGISGVTIERRLLPEDQSHLGMVRVGGGSYNALDVGPEAPVPAFWMDRYEVTNEQYKRFVDASGYGNADYWKHPVVRDEQQLTWEEAMLLFTDATGSPGPAGWRAGTYPAGNADHPVTGVSWYEATAYAEFVGKSLPTVYHFAAARRTGNLNFIVPQSNFAGVGTAPVGSYPGMSVYGAFDLAGNVVEWCLNASASGARFAAGGSYLHITYAAQYAYEIDPLTRDEGTGFRTVLSTDEEFPVALAGLLGVNRAEPFEPEPVSREEFEGYRGFYTYEPEPLEAEIEIDDDSASGWRVQKVSFNAAYGNPRERMGANLYLPKQVRPPYQTVIFLGADPTTTGPSSEFFREPSTLHWAGIPRLIESGRAVMYPFYKNYFERGADGSEPINPMESSAELFRYVRMLTNDAGRSIDYLEGNPDLFSDSVAYYGFSFGADVGSFFTAIEKRIDASIAVAGTVLPPNPLEALPAAYPVNYMPHITMPTLLINSVFDEGCPRETCALLRYELLGTPEEHKDLVQPTGGHLVRPDDIMDAMIPFLDEYLGPVQ